MESLIDTKQLSVIIGVSEQTLRNKVSRECFEDMPPPLRIGRLIKWRPSDVDQWLETKKIQPGSTPKCTAAAFPVTEKRGRGRPRKQVL